MNRAIVSLMIATVALFFTVTVFNNVVDYSNTFAFIEHTLSMDTTKQNSHFMWRAISNPILQHLAFVGIILFQALIAGLLRQSLSSSCLKRNNNICRGAACCAPLHGCITVAPSSQAHRFHP